MHFAFFMQLSYFEYVKLPLRLAINKNITEISIDNYIHILLRGIKN